jgi:hypothetical protein
VAALAAPSRPPGGGLPRRPTAWWSPATRTFSLDSELVHHRPDELLLFDTEEPNHAESVDEVAAATKVAALLAHRSQRLSTMGIGADDDGSQADAFSDSILAELAEVGQRFGVPLAEAFRRIDGL